MKRLIFFLLGLAAISGEAAHATRQVTYRGVCNSALGDGSLWSVTATAVATTPSTFAQGRFRIFSLPTAPLSLTFDGLTVNGHPADCGYIRLDPGQVSVQGQITETFIIVSYTLACNGDPAIRRVPEKRFVNCRLNRR